MPPRPLSSRETLFLGAVLLLGLLVRSLRLDAPFTGMAELDAAVYGQECRNVHRYGGSATFAWPCREAGRWPEAGPRFFHPTHWPAPLWANVLFQRVVGVGASPMPEASVRAVSVLAGALTPLLLYLIARRLADPFRAGAAAGLSAFLPGCVYFSQSVGCHHAWTILLGLCSGLAYFRWRERPGALRAGVLGLLLLLGCLSLWWGFYVVLVLALFEGRLRFGGALLGLALLAALGLWVWTQALPGGMSLLERGAYRAGGQPLGTVLARTVYRTALYHTLGALALACLGLLSSRGGWRRWILLWGGAALLDPLLFPQYWVTHPYSVYPLLPFVACAAAEGLHALWSSGRRALAAACVLAFLLQSAWLVERRYAQTDGYPLAVELAGAARSRLSFGEDLVAAFRVDAPVTEFYLDATVVADVHSEEDLEAVRKAHPGRRFRWLAAVRPEAVLALPCAGPRGIGRFLPPILREQEGMGTREEVLEAFGILPGDAAFRVRLDGRYAGFDAGPFRIYDLETPSSRP